MVDSIRIRRAHLQEADRLREIAVAAKGHWGYDPGLVRAWADADFTDANLARRELHVAEVDGRAVAWASIVDKGEVCWLEDLWVEPAWMRKGIGRRLFERAAERGRELGAKRLEWEAEPNAVEFYEAMGGRELRDSDETEWGRVLAVMGIDLPG